jgi:hypothetical protein
MTEQRQLTVRKWATSFLSMFIVIAEVSLCSELLAQGKKRPIEGIADNSFLVEEAYNQERGVVQHILTAEYSKDTNARGWAMSFTQEWPIFAQDHQFSYTIPFSFIHEGGGRQDGIEDVLLNYRYQALDESEAAPAFSPRFSLILPTGSRDRGKGSGVVGYEFQLPFSKALSDRVALNFNAGVNYLPHARARLESGRLSPQRFNASLHLMLEWAGDFEESITDSGRAKSRFQSVLSPGIRAAVLNGQDYQTVVGLAAPIGTNQQAQNYGVFLYFSFEHKFLNP